MFLNFEKVKKNSILRVALFNLVLILMFAMNPAGIMAASEIELKDGMQYVTSDSFVKKNVL